MKITVVGRGNIGTQFAVHIAEKGHDVTMFTSNPKIFSEHMSIIDRSGKTIHEGNIYMATNDPHRAFNDADVIIITMPPTMMIPLSDCEKKEEENNTLIPDLHSRYFTADFPYSLSVIQQIGKIAGADIPNIDSLIDWYDEIAIVNDKLIISDFGIIDMDSLREFYLQ